MRIVRNTPDDTGIIFEEYFKEQNPLGKPFALVRYAGCTEPLIYVPLHWLHRPQLARKATPQMELKCAMSSCPYGWISFRYNCRMVNVLQVFEGQTPDSLKSISQNSSTNPSNNKYEDELIKELQNASDDSSQTRTKALQEIVKMMSNQYMPEFMKHHNNTFIEIVRNTIRFGKDTETAIGVQILPLLILHSGKCEEMVSTLSPLFIRTILDTSMPADFRAKCCSAVALASFLGCKDDSTSLHLMQQLEKVFHSSNKTEQRRESTSDEVILQSSALSSWALLLTCITPKHMNRVTKSSMSTMTQLLKSSHLELRNSAGEVIALILESEQRNGDIIPKESLSDLVELVKQLATDSSKFRAKRDRRVQKVTFRDILNYIENGTTPELTIQFGDDSLCLNTWARHAQYKALCDVIGSGTNTHLAENVFLRDLFQIKEKSQEPLIVERQQREQRKRTSMNAITRSVSRKNQREERLEFKSSVRQSKSKS